MTKTWTINDIKTACRVRGSHWFDPGTMRFFKGRVLDTVYQGPNGIFFVSSEQYDTQQRRYTVRQFHPETADITTVGDFNVLTKHMAIKTAKAAAGEEHQETSEPYKAVSVGEQFLHELKTHTGRKVTVQTASQLIALATQHLKLMEHRCNVGDDGLYNDEGEEIGILAKNRAAITKLAKSMKCRVKFSGDPRGCTVKLILPNGETNDFGGEGWCIPVKGE